MGIRDDPFSRDDMKRISEEEPLDEIIESGSRIGEGLDGLEEINAEVVEERKQVKLEPSKIHGAYFSTSYVSNPQKVEALIQELKDLKLNAVVIDIKNDRGNVTFDSKNVLANEIGAVRPVIWNLSEMTELLHEEGIYVIGRLVAFRDWKLATERPSYAVKNTNGTLFKDRAGDVWLNPYYREGWEYLTEIAEEAVELGVDEIQFDYVRFSTEAKHGKVDFGVDSVEVTKDQVITEFVESAVERIHEKGGFVSADVFGAIIHSKVDAATVGQDYVELSKRLDFICPMIYPSHYADGFFDLAVPDMNPYELIYYALLDSAEELLQLTEQNQCANVRPWLQDFTASWKPVYQHYGKKQVEEEIQAVYDAGYGQWLLWNSAGKYSAR